MKRNSLAVIALLITAPLAAFETHQKFDVTVYMIYNSGAQNDRSSYAQQTSYPGTTWGEIVLNWIRITDNDGFVTDVEFDAWFAYYDTDSDNNLNDEGEIDGWLEKKLW